MYAIVILEKIINLKESRKGYRECLGEEKREKNIAISYSLRKVL